MNLPAEQDRLRPGLGDILKCPENGLPKRQDAITFLARHKTRRKCSALVFTPGFLRGTNRLSCCRVAPAGLRCPAGSENRDPGAKGLVRVHPEGFRSRYPRRWQLPSPPC